jgi:hypothetical protein
MRPRLATAHSLSQHDLSAILEVQSKGPDREAFLSPITHFRLLPSCLHPLTYHFIDSCMNTFIRRVCYTEMRYAHIFSYLYRMHS